MGLASALERLNLLFSTAIGELLLKSDRTSLLNKAKDPASVLATSLVDIKKRWIKLKEDLTASLNALKGLLEGVSARFSATEASLQQAVNYEDIAAKRAVLASAQAELLAFQQLTFTAALETAHNNRKLRLDLDLLGVEDDSTKHWLQCKDRVAAEEQRQPDTPDIVPEAPQGGKSRKKAKVAASVQDPTLKCANPLCPILAPTGKRWPGWLGCERCGSTTFDSSYMWFCPAANCQAILVAHEAGKFCAIQPS